MSHSLKSSLADYLCACLATVALVTNCWAQTAGSFTQQFPLKKGDTLESVQKYYGITSEPIQLNNSNHAAAGYFYFFPEYGVRINFDVNKKITTARFEHPFVGTVEGVAIGDSSNRVIELNGQPDKKVLGFPDLEITEEKLKRKHDIIDSLPDPASKELVSKAFAQIEQINASPASLDTAWLYPDKNKTAIRYDFGVQTDRVQYMMSENGADLVNPNAVTAALTTISPKDVADFFRQSDKRYNGGDSRSYMAQYAQNYSFVLNDHSVDNGKRAREAEVVPIFQNCPLRLAETTINSVDIAPDGRSAVAKTTTVERYRKVVAVVKRVVTQQVVRNVEHNIAVTDEQDAYLALIDGQLKITRAVIRKRAVSENEGT